MQTKYDKLPQELLDQMTQDKQNGTFGKMAFSDENVVRRNPQRDKNSVLRPSFVRDCEKILHLPVYNRYNDKTQVFSFYQNDDLSRRGLHVQLVSRIARNIGRLLGLNQDLIEAIALGHDLGHTPFGHAGERILDRLLYENTGHHFMHNVHSVRVLDVLYRRNVSLQTLDGILCHNGEFELQEYRPTDHMDFSLLDRRIQACSEQGEGASKQLVPATLEACVVRVSDMIAYLGKDRQDALNAHIIENMDCFSAREIGTHNAAIINNIMVDLVVNSYGKDHLRLSEGVYHDLKQGKKENGTYIYYNKAIDRIYDQTVAPMFRELYERLLTDLREQKESSPIYRHHLLHLKQHTVLYDGVFDYWQQDPHRIVVDYLASMTDSYFCELHGHLFPDSSHQLKMVSYFEDIR